MKLNIENQKEKKFNYLIAAPFWAWSILGIGFLILVSASLWVLFGKIPITVTGRGIVISDAGLFSVESKAEGSVFEVMVKPGTYVKKGDLLIQIFNPDLEIKNEKAKARLAMSREQFEDLKKDVYKEEYNYKKSLKIKKDALIFNIDQLQQEIDFANKEILGRKKLVDDGLISPLRYYEALQKNTEKSIEKQYKIGELATVNSEIKKEYRAQEIKQKERQLEDDIEDQKLLEVYLSQEKIYSPRDGLVLEILANTGEQVKVGTPLIWMEQSSNAPDSSPKYSIFGYFQVELGKRILPGTPVEMTVPSVNSNKYGTITGIVKDVSLYAVSQENIYNKIHNKTIIEFLTNKATAVVQVIIEPDRDPENPALFHWTSGEQPPVKITSGTVGSLEAIVEYVRPIFYLIPLPDFKRAE